jgi:short-subunit dehydrogenase
MKRQLHGARVVITGASQGIGAALADAAASRGAQVLIAARSQSIIEQHATRLRAEGHGATAVVADITSAADRNRLLAAAAERLGGLDILINNAGINARGLFEHSGERTLREIMETNFFAPAELIRQALPLLQAGRQPMIVNVGSASGRRGFPVRAEYSASKFALSGFSEVLRAELSVHGIDVLLVTAGHVRTHIAQHMIANTLPADRRGARHSRGWSPERAARSIVRAVEAGKHELVFPFSVRITLWLNRLLPRLMDYLTARHCLKHYGNPGPRPEPSRVWTSRSA